MDNVALIIALNQCLMFFSFGVNVEADLRLSISTLQYMGSDDYYACVGETVNLTCVFHKETSSMAIFKETTNRDILVKNGQLVTSSGNPKDKYAYQTLGKEHNLTITSLEISDSSYYACQGCTGWKWWCAIVSPWTGWSLLKDTVYLDVKNVTDTTVLPDFCQLVSVNTNGIFFIGHDLTLKCPSNVTLAIAGRKCNLTTVKVNNESAFNYLVKVNMTEQFTNSRITCFRDIQNDDIGKDYCKRLPNITVFKELLVTLTYDKNDVTNGENVNFICRSQPFLPFAVRWEIMNNSATYGNLTVWETSSDSRLSITNVNFRDSISSSLTVVCNATIGLVNRFEKVLVKHDIAPNTGKNIKLAAVVFPVIGVVVITTFGLIFLIYVYNKLRKPEEEKGLGSTHDQKTQNTGNVKVVCHISRDKEKVRLGLTKFDSEVADNAAYVSFETLQN